MICYDELDQWGDFMNVISQILYSEKLYKNPKNRRDE